MPTFETPAPIRLMLDIVVGDIRITASERTDTVIEVRPTNPDHELDVTAAANTRVEYPSGMLMVRGPSHYTHWRAVGSVDVTIELPELSSVFGSVAGTTVRAEGQLGEFLLTTGSGDLHLDRTGPLQLTTDSGGITVNEVRGNVEISAISSEIRIHKIDGSATIKNPNAGTSIGDISGHLRVLSADGTIAVDKARGALDAMNTNGHIRIGEVIRGPIGLQNGVGEIEVGISEGTEAWLDLHTTHGTVHNSLSATDAPQRSANTVELRASTTFGDILIHRR